MTPSTELFPIRLGLFKNWTRTVVVDSCVQAQEQSTPGAFYHGASRGLHDLCLPSKNLRVQLQKSNLYLKILSKYQLSSSSTHSCRSSRGNFQMQIGAASPSEPLFPVIATGSRLAANSASIRASVATGSRS